MKGTLPKPFLEYSFGNLSSSSVQPLALPIARDSPIGLQCLQTLRLVGSTDVESDPRSGPLYVPRAFRRFQRSPASSCGVRFWHDCAPEEPCPGSFSTSTLVDGPDSGACVTLSPSSTQRGPCLGRFLPTRNLCVACKTKARESTPKALPSPNHQPHSSLVEPT